MAACIASDIAHPVTRRSAPLRDRSNSCPSFGGECPQRCAPRVRSRVGSGARVERRGSTSRSLALNPAAMWTLLRRPLASDPRGRETGGYPRYDRSPANYFPGRTSGHQPGRPINQTRTGTDARTVRGSKSGSLPNDYQQSTEETGKIKPKRSFAASRRHCPRRGVTRG